MRIKTIIFMSKALHSPWPVLGSDTVGSAGIENAVASSPILGDPGAGNGGEGKSKRLEKYGTKNSKLTAKRAPGDNVLPDQFQTVAAVLPSDWAGKLKSFLAPPLVNAKLCPHFQRDLGRSRQVLSINVGTERSCT